MNRFYLIAPLVMSLIFGGIYFNHTKHADEAAAIKLAEVAKLKDEEEAKKAEAERKAREDGEKRTAARALEENKKEEDKIAKWNADGAKIAEETAGYNAAIAKYTAEVAGLEKEIGDLRTSKELAIKEVFAQAREVEMAHIAKRTAEFEIQRLTEMVARKAGNTSLVKTP
jgi:cell division protein FtsB